MKFVALKLSPSRNLVLLQAAFCIAWMAYIGKGRTWGSQIGQWTAGIPPWFGNVAFDFAAMALAFSAVLFLLRRHVTSRRMAWLLAFMLVAGQIAAVLAARKIVFGTFPHGIDHPAFMFRVREFGEIFPRALGGYNPWWNAGTEHFIGVTSGAQNFGILILPFMKMFGIEAVYGPAILLWMVVGFPWLAVLSLRAAGVRWSGAFAGGMMMCAATRAMFLFFWQSGNVGAMVSSMLGLPVVALGWRFVVLRRGRAGAALALGLAAWLVSIWSPGTFVCVGVVLGWLLCFRHWELRPTLWLFAGGALALLLLSPWLWTTFFPCRGILEYVGKPSAAQESRLQMLAVALRQFSRRLQEFHPLLIAFGLGTSFLGLRRDARRTMLAVVIVLCAMTLSVGFKRQSQLDRMAIHLAMVCILPAALQIGRLLASHAGSRHIAHAIAQGTVLALLVCGLRVSATHLANQGGFKMWPSQASISEFVSVVQREVPEDARLAFAGMTDCRYEWGKPSFLPILAKREMMADDYYGYPKGLIAYNYPPKPYRKTIEGVVAFSQAYGITHWTTADPYWHRVFSRSPEHFRLVHSMPMQSSTVDLYKCTDVENPTRFYKGEGRVDARENRIDVFTTDPEDGYVIIRYNWRDGLTCMTPGACIKPANIDGNLSFIAVSPNGNEKVSIGYRPSWAPIKPNFDGTFHH